MLNWIKTKWASFHNWVASKFPGMKTKAVAAVGSISSAAAAGQEYITNQSIAHYITPDKLMLTSALLFTLAFWFRGMTQDK